MEVSVLSVSGNFIDSYVCSHTDLVLRVSMDRTAHRTEGRGDYTNTTVTRVAAKAAIPARITTA